MNFKELEQVWNTLCDMDVVEFHYKSTYDEKTEESSYSLEYKDSSGFHGVMKLDS